MIPQKETPWSDHFTVMRRVVNDLQFKMISSTHTKIPLFFSIEDFEFTKERLSVIFHYQLVEEFKLTTKLNLDCSGGLPSYLEVGKYQFTIFFITKIIQVMYAMVNDTKFSDVLFHASEAKAKFFVFECSAHIERLVNKHSKDLFESRL